MAVSVDGTKTNTGLSPDIGFLTLTNEDGLSMERRLVGVGGIVLNDNGPNNTLEIDGSGVGGGNTLDQAYDQGGAGAGAVITADAGPVQILGTDGLDISGTGSVGAPLIEFTASALNPGFYISGNELRIAAFNRNNITIGGDFVRIQPTSSGMNLLIDDTNSTMVWASGTATSQKGVRWLYSDVVASNLTTEFPDFDIANTKTTTWTVVPPATMRAVRIGQPTYAANVAQTIALAVTLSIDGAPIAGPLMTLTKSLAVDVNGDTRVTGLFEVVGDLKISGQALGPAGTSFDPTWSFTIDPDTGVIRSGPNRLGLVTDGTLHVEVSEAGDLKCFQGIEIDGALNHDGTLIGFNGTAPTAQSTGWAVSNVTPDKVFDADTVAIAELADVVGTLIDYLKTRGDLAA